MTLARILISLAFFKGHCSFNKRTLYSDMWTFVPSGMVVERLPMLTFLLGPIPIWQAMTSGQS